MSELEDKLSAILGNPQAMSQIMSLAQSLGGGSAAPAPPPREQTAPPPQEIAPEGQNPPSGQNVPDLSALLGGLSGGNGLDPKLMAMAGRIMEEYQSGDDGKAALLQALRPFVKERRYAKLDKAVQIARLSRVIRVALDALKGGGATGV